MARFRRKPEPGVIFHGDRGSQYVVRGFKVSRDPKFVEKLEDIVGLCHQPPGGAASDK